VLSLPVERLTITLHRKALPEAITNGILTQTHASIVMVRAQSQGIEGIGWVTGDEIVWQAAQTLAPLVEGEDAVATERLWAALYQPKRIGRRGLTTRAVSAIDIALWDLKAKALGVPLWRLLGGATDRVRGYIAGGYYTASGTKATLAAEMRRNVERGARAVKMKIGAATFREDLERVAAVRAEVGEEVDLLVDANGRYRTDEAREMARLLAPFYVFWLEEPVSWENLAGYALLRRDGLVRIAGGENEYTRYGFRDLLAAQACDVLNADAQVLGGISEWIKVNHLAQAAEVALAPHGNQEVHIHLATGLAGTILLEYYPREVVGLMSDMVLNPLTFVHGDVLAPEGPGLGVEIDWRYLETCRVL